MTDIDFEEIDRAVASASREQGVDLPTSNDGPSQQPAQSAKPDIVQRSRGRVMDIVHPPRSMDRKSLSPISQSEKSGETVGDDVNKDNSSNASESPFIADAKIEKRPLGGERSEPRPEPQPDKTDGDLQLDTEPNYATNDMIDAPLPEELHPELMSLEDSNFEAETKAEDKYTPEPLSIAPKHDTPEETETVSIYDTDTYHKPLSHPQKSKSGILTTVWIILIIVLGVGVGLVSYFYILPLL